jgi:F-type H+-transporting ATPase subunit gamma
VAAAGAEGSLGKHKLLAKNKVGSDLMVLIGPDKGLTGGMISNLLKQADHFAKDVRGNKLQVITIGKRARDFAVKMGYEVIAEFSNFPEQVGFSDSLPISRLILDGYKSKKFKEVNVVYMDFVSTLVQKANVNKILPFELQAPIIESPEELIDVDVESRYEYLFEPSAEEILDWLLPYYVEILMFQTLLEAKASEHSSRMVAMKNASDNAAEIIDSLTLEFNKSRQAAITNELLDIVTAAYAN